MRRSRRSRPSSPLPTAIALLGLLLILLPVAQAAGPVIMVVSETANPKSLQLWAICDGRLFNRVYSVFQVHIWHEGETAYNISVGGETVSNGTMSGYTMINAKSDFKEAVLEITVDNQTHSCGMVKFQGRGLVAYEEESDVFLIELKPEELTAAQWQAVTPVFIIGPVGGIAGHLYAKATKPKKALRKAGVFFDE